MIWLLLACGGPFSALPPSTTPGQGVPTLPMPPEPTPAGPTGPGGPVAVIEANALSGELPLSIHLDASASSGSDLTYAWWVHDAAAGSTPQLDHTFLGSGTATVKLTVTDAEGATSTAEAEVAISSASCPTTGAYDIPGEVFYEPLEEISGMGFSRANPGVLWVHNDTTGGPARQLHALDETGMLLGEFSFDNDHGDWEDMAVGHDETGDPVIFVGSFGNNEHNRGFLSILVVPEPVVALGKRVDGLLDFHEMEFEYPDDGDYNCEALMFDPQTGALLLVTKSSSGTAHVFSAAAPHDEDLVVLEELTVLDFSKQPLSGGATTAASISPLGDQIVIRTYSNTAYIFRRDASASLTEAFTTDEPCPVGLQDEPQGEAIDFSPAGDALWTISEEDEPPIHRTFLK